MRHGLKIIKEDIFYYIYSLFRSPGYRKTFVNNLKKMLSRLLLVENPVNFWAFYQAGRQLAELYLNYEDQKKPPEVTVTGLERKNFTVTKMSFIPEKVYRYIANGKSVIEWIMERYTVTTHKESGIKNILNYWIIEDSNLRYILDLLLSVITVSLKMVDIVVWQDCPI
jgi:predicted helicase